MVFLEACGRLEVVDERMMDAVGCVSGCSPAYVYMFIEALADGAVKVWTSKSQGIPDGSQTVLGSAKLVLETGKASGSVKGTRYAHLEVLPLPVYLHWKSGALGML